MSKNLGGRPVVHGLKAITGHRIRQARLAFASGKSRRKVSSEIFKLSPRTFVRYLELEDPKAKALRRAVEEGEKLKGEPLGTLICMLIDKRDQLCAERSPMMYQLPPDGEPIDYSKIQISEENAELYCDLMKQIQAIESRIKQAITDNDELKSYINLDGREGGDTLHNRTSDHAYLELDDVASELGLPPLEIDDYKSHRMGHKPQEGNEAEN
jgi:hypothetical protein